MWAGIAGRSLGARYERRLSRETGVLAGAPRLYGGLSPREPALGCLAQEEETRVVCGGLEAASTLAGAVLRAGEEQPVPRPANKSARREM